MNSKLIAMFGKEIGCEAAVPHFKEVNMVSMKLGYIIHPKCCTHDVLLFLREQKYNPNSTFYKTWEDVTSKSRAELWLDQILHYLSTYGTNHTQEGNGYVPNENPELIPFETYKIITPATVEEIVQRCANMLYSGIALSEDTLNLFSNFILENKGDIDVDKIKNKEAQAILSIRTGKMPSDEFGMLRVLVYAATGSAMLVNSKRFAKTVEDGKDVVLSKLTSAQQKKLSRIFLRYKPIFLAFKKNCAENRPVINRIRKLAIKNHTPMVPEFWTTVLNPKDNKSVVLARAAEKAEELNNYRKVAILQAIRERMYSKNTNGRMFVVRTGRMFVRENYKSPCDFSYLSRLYTVVEGSLIKSLSKKACTFKVHPSISLTCPTSEKNFIANFPLGTNVSIGKDHNVIGIYWRNEWGTRDFDLSYYAENGVAYGWNGSYHSADGVIYSGDMTSANPEATELIYFPHNVPDGIVRVNKYSGGDESKLKLFLAKEDCSKEEHRMFKNAMVRPESIVADMIIEHSGDREKTVAFVHNNKMFLMDISSGNTMVANNERSNIINQQMKNKADSFVDLFDILTKAGFEMVDFDKEAELDLTTPSKDVLIDLFA